MRRSLIALLCLMLTLGAAEAGFKARVAQAGAIVVCTKTNLCKRLMMEIGEVAIVALIERYGAGGFLACIKSTACIASMSPKSLVTPLPASSSTAAASGPPGNCGHDQYEMLNRRVAQACKGGLFGSQPSACKARDDLFALDGKMQIFSDCVAAREARENACFGGGDAGHRQQITQLENGFYKCVGFADKLR